MIFYNAKSVFLAVNASLRWLNNVTGVYLVQVSSYFPMYEHTFIRIHWYTVPPIFQFTVWEDGFDYIVFFSNGNIRYDTTFSA
jgi:hypothetical protein